MRCHQVIEKRPPLCRDSLLRVAAVVDMCGAGNPINRLTKFKHKLCAANKPCGRQPITWAVNATHLWRIHASGGTAGVQKVTHGDVSVVGKVSPFRETAPTCCGQGSRSLSRGKEVAVLVGEPSLQGFLRHPNESAHLRLMGHIQGAVRVQGCN